MAEQTFPLQIVSPAKIVFSGAVSMVEVPGSEGDFAVLAGHSPLFSMIRPGIVTIHEGATKRYFVIEAGYADVTPEGTTILAEAIRDIPVCDVNDEVIRLAQRGAPQATPRREKRYRLQAIGLAGPVRSHERHDIPARLHARRAIIAEMRQREPMDAGGGHVLSFVMPGLVPGIHVFAASKMWMAGTSPAMTQSSYGVSKQKASHTRIGIST